MAPPTPRAQRPEWAEPLPKEFDAFLRPDGTYAPRTAWPAPTYASWYPSPCPDPHDPTGPSVAERIADPDGVTAKRKGPK